MKKAIKEFSGRILGYVDYDYSGSGKATAFSGRILGTYDSRNDYTKDFSGRILYQGDCLSALVILESKGMRP